MRAVLILLVFMSAFCLQGCKSLLTSAPDYYITEYKGNPLIIKDADLLVRSSKKASIKELNFEQVKDNVVRPLKKFSLEENGEVKSDKVVITLELDKLIPYELPKH